jgi:DNA sulfur modification protein DndB
MTTVAAIKGKMGDITYYQCTMKTKDVISRTESAIEYFSKEDWQEMGADGQMQREPSKRYLTDIAPYLIRTKKRFFNSIVVLLDPKLCQFKSLDEYPVKIGSEFKPVSKLVDFDYQEKAATIGFLSIKDTGHMLILDGQHRMLALRAVAQKRAELEKILIKQDDNYENYLDHGVFEDDISVIFVNLESRKDQRKVFGDINTYAKTVSQKERIFISEDNGYFKITQDFVSNNPFKDDFINFVNLKGTSLPDRSTKLTTGKHINEMVEYICREAGYKFPKQGLPTESDLDLAKDLCRNFLKNFFTKIKAFNLAFENMSSIPELREHSNHNKYALLFKPMPQVALLQAIHYIKENADIDEDAIYKSINKIDWSIDKGSQWEGIVMTNDQTILTGKSVQDRLRDIIIYFVLGESKFKNLENGQERYDELLKKWQLTTKSKDNKLPEPKLK